MTTFAMRAISGGILYLEGIRAQAAAESGWALISSNYDTSLLSAFVKFPLLGRG